MEVRVEKIYARNSRKITAMAALQFKQHSHCLQQVNGSHLNLRI